MRDPAARGAILRWWVACSLFALFLLFPGEARSPFSGIPLSSQATILAGATLILAVFTAFFRPARPSSPLWSVLLLTAVIGKLLLAPGLVQNGWRAQYWTSKANYDGRRLPFEPAYFQSGVVARPYRIDRSIDYEGVTFGLSFLNDLVESGSRLPRDVTQPLVVHWTGYVDLDRAGVLTIPVSANGGIAVSLDGKAVFRATNPRGASTGPVQFTPGVHVIQVTYTKPPGVKPGAHVLLPAQTTPGLADREAIRGSGLAAAAIAGLGALALLALTGALVSAYRPLPALLRRTIRPQPDKLAAVLFAAIAIMAGVRISIPARHATMQLGAGDDPLVYEAYSRLINRNGLLLRKDNGTAKPYFFYPLYSYLLAAAHGTFGDDPSTIILFNYFCIAAIGPLMWGILRNRLPRGSIVVALGAVGLFTGTYLLRYVEAAFTDNLFIPMVLAVILATVEALTQRSVGWMFLTGVLTALGVATRPSLLIHVPFVVVLLLLYRDLGSLTRRCAAVAAFLAGFIVAISPFTLRNWLVSGDFVLLVNNYVSFPMYLLGPGDVARSFATRGQLPGFFGSVSLFLRIFASRPLHFAWIEICKVLYTLGLTRFGPYGRAMPQYLFVYPFLFVLALWWRKIDKPVAAAILVLCASHMTAMLAATPYSYGYKTILPFHVALLAGVAFLLNLEPWSSRVTKLPDTGAGPKPSVSILLRDPGDSVAASGTFIRDGADEVLTVAAGEDPGRALLEAVRKSHGDCIVICDGGGRYDPSDVARLLSYASDFDVVFASRVSQVPLWRRFVSEPSLLRGWIIAKYVQVLYNAPTLTDVCTGLQLMQRDVAAAVFAETVAHGGKYSELEMMIATLRRGSRVVQIPVAFSPAPHTASWLATFFTGLEMIAVVSLLRLRDVFRRDRYSAECAGTSR